MNAVTQPSSSSAATVDSEGVGVAARIVGSLLATAVGWLSAVGVCLLPLAGSRDDLLRSLKPVSFVVGLHVLAAWLLAVTPLALTTTPNAPIARPGWAACFGAVCGVLLLSLAFALFWGTYLPSAGAWSWFAAAGACGAVTWELTALVLRRRM